MSKGSNLPDASARLTQALQWLRADTWRFRFLPACLGACASAALFLLTQKMPPSSLSYGGWYIVWLTALGGAFSGYLMSGWFGRPGRFGAALAIIGAWMASGLGGTFTGTLIQPVAGTLVGAAAGLYLPLFSLTGFVTWLLLCIVMHISLKALRDLI